MNMQHAILPKPDIAPRHWRFQPHPTIIICCKNGFYQATMDCFKDFPLQKALMNHFCDDRTEGFGPLGSHVFCTSCIHQTVRFVENWETLNPSK